MGHDLRSEWARLRGDRQPYWIRAPRQFEVLLARRVGKREPAVRRAGDRRPLVL
jgi:hypothetical protein